jgi:hypothetical protein
VFFGRMWKSVLARLFTVLFDSHYFI